MEFRDFAAAETTTLVSRLLAGRADAAVERLRHLRDALDAAVSDCSAPASFDDDVQELVARLTAAAGAAVRRAREEGRAAVEAVREQLEAEQLETTRLTAALADLEAQAVALRADVQREKERADANDRDLVATIEAHHAMEAAFREADAGRRDESRAREAAERELREALEQLEAGRSEAERLAAALAAEKAANEALQADLTTTIEAHASVELALREAEAAARRETQAREALEDDLRAAHEQLDAMRAELEAAQRAREAHEGEIAALQRQLDDAHDARVDLEIARDVAMADAAAQAESRAAVEADLQSVREALDAALADAARLGARLEAVAAEQSRLLAELSTAQGELHTSEAQREALGIQLKASTTRVQTLERNLAAAEDTIRHLENRLEDAREAETARHRDSADARADAAGLQIELDRLSALVEASTDAVDDLARAGSIADLLSALADRLASAFPRVAVFRVKGNRLMGEHQRGFDAATDVSKLVIPLNVDSVLTRAATSGTAQSVSAADPDDSGIPFGGAPSTMLAVPLMLHGEALAVVYADDAGDEVNEGTEAGSSSLRFATLLTRLAEIVLTRLTHELKKLTELREYAAMLLLEAEEMYSADAAAGKTTKELRSRLKDTLECGRQLYAQRAALEGPAAAGLFDEQIAALLDKNSASAFARDLAAVTSSGRKSKSRAAEAS